MTTDGRRCSMVYVSGYRLGQPCPYRASSVVVLPGSDWPPFLTCGYHDRAYTPDVIYPLNWSLAEIRRFQTSNLDALLEPS